MSNDILGAKLVLSKEENRQDSSVYADFSVLLSSSFSAPTILVNFNNTLDASTRDSESEQQWVTLRRDSTNGEYKARLELSPYSPSAVYQFKALQATDVNGRNLFIEQSNEFIRLGLDKSKYSFFNPFTDKTSPSLTSVSFGQWTKTEAGEFAVDISFKLKDDLSGIGYSNNTSNGDGQYVDYNNPGSGRSFFIGLNGPSDFSGVATIADQPDSDGNYSGTGRVVLSKYAPSGNYILQLRVPDRAGNTSWGDRYLMGTPASITLNNPQQDISAPALSEFTLAGSFDAFTGRPVINLKGKLSDDISGVQLAWLNLEGPDGSRTITNGGVNQDINGNFDTYIALPIPFTSGTYFVSGNAVDNARNDVWWSKLTELSIVAPSTANPNGGILQGTDVSEMVFGSQGNDVISAGGGNDDVICGSGNDVVNCGSGNDKVAGGNGNDQLNGGTGDDFLYSGDGDDVVDGGDGNDEIVGGDGKGNDTYKGGAGRDTVRYSSAVLYGITVDLSKGTANGTEIGSDDLEGIENIVGGSKNDSLTGDSGNNIFEGGAGDDSIIGGGGTDTSVFSGKYSDYKITKLVGNSYTIQDNRGIDGSDQIQDISTLRFNDIDKGVNDLNPAATYTTTPSAHSLNEGTTLTTTVEVTNVAAGTTLYYALSGIGITTADFSTGALTGSGTVGTDSKFSIDHAIANDLTTEGSEYIEIKLFTDSSRSIQVGSTASAHIADTSKTPTNNGNGTPLTATDAKALVISQGFNVVIPDGITSIEQHAFYGTSISSIVIPDSVTSIGDFAFELTPLKSAIIGDGVITIGAGAFLNCFYLTNAIIGNSVKTIGNSAFAFSRALTSIAIPGGAYIGETAFYDSALTKVTIGSNVAMSPSAFDEGVIIDYLEINDGNGSPAAITSSTATVFQEGVTLSAPVVTGDIDGDATSPNYSYQWFKGSTAITNATASTFAVPAFGAGTYKVAVTYTDAQGFTATLDSPEQVVSTFNNGNGTPGSITGNGAFQEGVTLTAPVVTGDPDGDALNPNYSYQWFKGSAAITNATASTYAVPASGTGTYKVAITYTDAQNFRVTIDSPNKGIAGSNIPAYTITPSASTLNEGAGLTTTVATTNVKSGTKLYYSLGATGINAADFSKGSLTGFGTVAANGRFSFLHTIKNDLNTEGDENLEIKLFSDTARTKQVGSTATVVIKDTSLTPITSYTITPSATIINEGEILTTSVATTNVRSGTKLYYSLSGEGINTADFSKGSLAGFGTVAANGRFSFIHTIKNDLNTEGDENLEIKLFSDTARTKQVGSTASVVIKDTSTAPIFRDIGTLAVRSGTRGVDRITGQGGEVVYGGASNDILTGLSKISDIGEWIIPSFLSGGLGNDQYNVTQGAFAMIIDAGGGTDTVSAPSMNINNIEFIRVNQRDIYATDGNSSVLLVDPQGLQGSQQKLENFVIGKNRYSLAQLTKIAGQSDYFGGDYTYTQLQSLGWLNLAEVGIDPLAINAYMADASYNNSIVA